MRTNPKPPTVTIIILLCKKLQCCSLLRAKQIGQRKRWCFGLVYVWCLWICWLFDCYGVLKVLLVLLPSSFLESSGVFIKIRVMCGYKSTKTRQQSFLWSVLRDSLYQNPGKTKRLAYTAEAPSAIYSVWAVPKTEQCSACTITWNTKQWGFKLCMQTLVLDRHIKIQTLNPNII